MQLEPYLFFEGRCEEALDFYRRTLGAQVEGVVRFKDAPKEMQECPGGMTMPPDSVMHARLRIGDTWMMASDGQSQGKPRFEGFSLSVTVKDDAEAKRVYEALAQGGQPVVPLAPSFFATSFGMVADRFGVSWMVVALNPQWAAKREEATAAA